MVNIINDPLLLKITQDIENNYGCHTIILYGSRARNEAAQSSDYDIFAIREKGETERDCRLFENVYLDTFIYSEKEIKKPDTSFIRIKDGIVLCQKNKMGDQLLNKVKKIFKNGPPKISSAEKQVIIPWAYKMLNRAKEEDIEGNFRRHWLLYDLLTAYFNLRDQWYLGPKESFQWLKQNDLLTYAAFEKALKPNADLSSIEKLIRQIELGSENPKGLDLTIT